MQRQLFDSNERKAFRFCNECGAANMEEAIACLVCQQPLADSALQSAAQPSRESLSASATPASIVSPGSGSLVAGRYQLQREIGRGGFGVVYLADDHKRNQQVVVKQIPIGKLSTREVIDATDSYNREVTHLSKLTHRHLPRLHDHFTDPDHWYLVMDYIEGQTLEELIQARSGKPLPLRQVIALGLQLCDVLEYLHTRTPPIIFRDVKPANIMLTPHGQIYLIDFGIARRFSANLSRDTAPLGSPGYAAPEQYGKSQTTPRTDIYGLGMTLQTLATGKDPLEFQAGETSLPSRTWRKRQFALLLSEMQEGDSRRRPHSVHEVRERLKRLQRWKGALLRPVLLGILLGIAPYVIVVGLWFLFSFLGQTVAYVLWLLLSCAWPFIFAGQLITAIAMLFQSQKRFMALGILIGLALIVLVYLWLGVFPLPV